MGIRLDEFWKKTACALATGLGVGLIPVMPGTFGSLWGLVLAWAFQQLALAFWVHAAILFVILAAGVPICARAATVFEQKDPGKIVYDELASIPLVFLLVALDWKTGLIGFLAFRLFDILKPWPLRRLERWPGGLGVMADDVGAALYATATLWVIVSL